MNLRNLFQKAAPFLVSFAAIAYLAGTSDVKAAFSHLDAQAARVLIPALLVYGVVSLFIEALTLVRLVPPGERHFGVWTASRVKAATYLMNVIHIAIGAGALTFLLRRRAGIGLIEAAGIVILIMMFDLGMLLVMVALGISLLSTSAPAVQIGLILILIGIICGGFALLRAPFSLGPLDRVREHRLFRAARTTQPRKLVETGILRTAFVLSFLGLGWAAFRAFGLAIPLGDFLVNFSAVALVAVLPSVAGIGPSQVGMVEFFSPFADRETLLACSIALSAGIILLRAGMGFLFAREFTREAYAAGKAAQTEAQA